MIASGGIADVRATEPFRVGGRTRTDKGDVDVQRFWGWLGVTLGRHAVRVAVVTAILLGLAGVGINRLEFATGQDSYLNTDEDVYIDNVAYQDLFGGQAVLGLITMDEGHSVTELFDADGIAEFDELYADLSSHPDHHFQSVVTPLDVLRYTDTLIQGGEPGSDPTTGFAGTILLNASAAEEPGSEAATIRTEQSLKTLERVEAVPADERTFDNPDWIEFLTFANNGEVRPSINTFFDPTHATVVVRLEGNASLEDEGAAATAAVERLREMDFANASITATGASILLKDINDYLRGGMLMLGGIAVVVMMIILLTLFDVRWRLLPLATILIGVVLAFGLAGFLGIPLTIVTIAGLPVMLGVGIDYAIQMHARVEEEVILDRNPQPIQEAARKLGPALLVVTLDAVFAFLALRFARVPMIRDFGLLLAVGIAVICLTSIVAPLAALGAREYRSPTKGRDFTKNALSVLTVKLGRLPQATVGPMAVASIAIFVGGILVEDDLNLQTDPVEWVNQSSQTISDIRTIEHEVGSSGELGVFFQSDQAASSDPDLFSPTSDIFTDENMQMMHDIRMRQLTEFGPDSDAPRQSLTAVSMEQLISDIAAFDGATPYVPTGYEARLAWELAPPDIQRALISPELTDANLIFRISPGSIDDLAVLVNDMRATVDPDLEADVHILAPEGTSATPSGLAVVGVGLLENIEANRVLLTYLSMGFVFVFLAVRLRSVVRSALSLVPVATAVGAASLVAWILDFNLSPMTAVGGPLVIAACTEFTSLILLRFVEERQRGIEPQEASDLVAARTGRAFIVSALTGIAGVAVLSFSSLPLLRDFGRVVGMNVAVALLSALIVLPPLLVWAERRGGWVSRGLVKPTDEAAPQN